MFGGGPVTLVGAAIGAANRRAGQRQAQSRRDHVTSKRRAALVGDVDHDPGWAGEPEDAKAGLAAQPEAEGDKAFEVAGVLDLAQVGAARHDHARQEGASAVRVSTSIADQYAY